MVNLYSFLLSFVLTTALYYFLFSSIQKNTVVVLNDEAIDIEFVYEEKSEEKEAVSTKIEEKEEVAEENDLDSLFEDSDYKKVSRKIQRYDLSKIEKTGKVNRKALDRLFESESENTENASEERNDFQISKEYYETKSRSDESIDKKYLRLVQKALIKNWNTKEDDSGKRATIRLKIFANGNFVYAVTAMYGDSDFKKRLLSSLEKLKAEGLEPPQHFLTINVNFIAKE